MGLKEMETTVSTLHKQNFDLKLELFHRRERQNALEQRIDALETEKAQIDGVNDRLLDEIEKRDKAVQEAVQMIVTLEARVAQLLEEREMVRQVEVAGYLPLEELESRLSGPTPKPNAANLVRLEEDAKGLSRVPSFLSVRSDKTDNLREVYISSRGSALSLPRLTTEGMEDPETRRINSLTSPSLSVLSESSFVSVYGERDSQGRPAVSDITEPSMMDGASRLYNSRKPPSSSEQAKVQRPSTAASATSRRPSRSESVGRTPGPGQFQSIHDIIDHTSPLQRLARLDYAYLDKPPTQDQSPLANKGQPVGQNKNANREALRRVATDTPVPRSGDQTLPPTPDTISTSTLRRLKTSYDTLPRQTGVTGQHSHPSISDGVSKAEQTEHTGGVPVFQQAVVSASGRHEPVHTACFDTRPPLIPRPRSAGDTTVSHFRDVDWDSDADSTHSLDSSLDIWLQQGREPKDHDHRGRESPALFNFPPSGGGWATNAMFGSSGGAFGVPGLASGYGNPVEDLLSAQEVLFPNGAQVLSTPDRRSSLGVALAPTSSSKQPPANGKLRKLPSRGNSRRNSVDAQSMHVADSAAYSQHHPEAKTGARSKDNHYPPSTGAASRGHRLNIFRRSIGGGAMPAQHEPSYSVEDQSATAAAKIGPMGVPSWVQRSGIVDDDRDSATPPPIMRNPRPGRSTSVDEGAPLNERTRIAPITPMAHHDPMTPPRRGTPTSVEATPSTNGATGGVLLNKRKWLPGFGRTNSLRNRAG
ncbi:hypothetical protein CCHL11_04123 [Colletotrichum chlorophyti]|uniref:Centrosomin N-terminal motif 1 domain-containing protein n=1 Tax=Colletotrichum chlorophyti TaxID=708187 RepID=A0A1Q8RQ14_9PEZI|nr:hypothetical protein CCHL11_04123 [Colletotrichum chlorophyti]